MAGAVQVLEGLGARLTHVASVRPCPSDSTACCAHKRGEGPADKGNFEKLCANAKPHPLRVLVGGQEPQKRRRSASPPPAEPAQGTEGLHMARRRHRRHAALAEYGEPLGDVGFLGDLLDKRDLVDYGMVTAGGLAAAVVAPKAISLVDKIGFIPFGWRAYVKGAAGIVGGFAAYKYLGRKVPAKYRDAVVAAAAVLAASGASTIAHEIFDKGTVGVKLKGLHGLGDLFPMTLKDIGDAEQMMLAELSAIEDQALAADMNPAFGAFDALVATDEDGLPAEMAFADGLDADVEPGQLEGFDASVEPENAWAYEQDVDLDQLSLVQA